MNKPTINEKLLRLLFQSVGLEYTPEQTKGDTWYQQHTWNEDQRFWFQSNALKVLKQHRIPQPEAVLAWWELAYGWKDGS